MERSGMSVSSRTPSTTTSLSTTTTTTADLTNKTYISAPIHDRQSTFLAHFHPAATSARNLQSSPSFATASHRIAGWRLPSKQKVLFSAAATTTKVLFETGFDDDGESYAGKKVVKVLEELGVQGVVVVGRWYGGVLLGPVRFAHIERCAREAVGAYLDAVAARDGGGKGKKRKVDDVDGGEEAAAEQQERERKRLVRELPERDESIATLRTLLAEKKGEVGGSQRQGASPGKPVAYERMGVEALRRLEKARDATLGWLLKSIDEAEDVLSAVTREDEGESGEEEKKKKKEDKKKEQEGSEAVDASEKKEEEKTQEGQVQRKEDVEEKDANG